MARIRSWLPWLWLPSITVLGLALAKDGEPRHRKILITAFEAFDDLPVNSSERVLDEIRRRHGSKFEYLVLPVDASAEPKLRHALRTRNPTAVISLGEDRRLSPSTCNLEPFALDARLMTGVHENAKLARLPSPWAAKIASELGLQLSPGWGAYYCNRIHRLTLRWAKRRAPALFVHVAREGNSETMASKIVRFADVLNAEVRPNVSSGS